MKISYFHSISSEVFPIFNKLRQKKSCFTDCPLNKDIWGLVLTYLPIQDMTHHCRLVNKNFQVLSDEVMREEILYFFTHFFFNLRCQLKTPGVLSDIRYLEIQTLHSIDGYEYDTFKEIKQLTTKEALQLMNSYPIIEKELLTILHKVDQQELKEIKTLPRLPFIETAHLLQIIKSLSLYSYPLVAVANLEQHKFKNAALLLRLLSQKNLNFLMKKYMKEDLKSAQCIALAYPNAKEMNKHLCQITELEIENANILESIQSLKLVTLYQKQSVLIQKVLSAFNKKEDLKKLDQCIELELKGLIKDKAFNRLINNYLTHALPKNAEHLLYKIESKVYQEEARLKLFNYYYRRWKKETRSRNFLVKAELFIKDLHQSTNKQHCLSLICDAYISEKNFKKAEAIFRCIENQYTQSKLSYSLFLAYIKMNNIKKAEFFIPFMQEQPWRSLALKYLKEKKSEQICAIS